MIVEPAEIKFVRTLDGQQVGVTSGCFDLPHFYHLHYLQRCRALCDVLIVGVDADDVVKRNKGTFPAMPDYQRVQMVAALRCVNAAFVLRSLNDLKKAGESADFLFKNGTLIYDAEIVGAETAELVVVEDVEEVQSTTELKKKIASAYDKARTELSK